MGGVSESAGIAYSVEVADIDEKAIRREHPEPLVWALGLAKAQAIREKILGRTPAGEDGSVQPSGGKGERAELPAGEGGSAPAGAGGASSRPRSPPSGLLITCDQVVVDRDDVILEKPESDEEARRFIRGYSSSVASTVGSVVVTDLASARQAGAVVRAELSFARIPEDDVIALVEEGLVARCAGALMVEHDLVRPKITGLRGTRDNVMGLPGAVVASLLAEVARGGGKTGLREDDRPKAIYA